MITVNNLMRLEDDSGYWLWDDDTIVSWWGYSYFVTVNHIAYIPHRRKIAVVDYRDKRAKAGE